MLGYRLQQLDTQVQAQRESLLAKDIKISHLEDTIRSMNEPSQPKRKLTEEETQCSFGEDTSESQKESLRRLSEVLTTREQEGINLHLTVKNLE